MNWVGGSRTRVLIKQEKRKQKEYFEKKRLKSKMKLLGVSSPVKNSAVSLDLLNLYVVNQISCQKKTSEIVRKPTHVNMNRDIKMHIRQHDLELPMTPPCVPSNLCIDDRENNVHCQRLGGKEELGLVQSSQAMDSCRSFKPQFSRIENCSFTPSFSAEFSSNSHIAKQNFTSGIAPSSQKVAFEQSRVNSQDACSPYKTAQFGELFERLNSPGNRNFLPGRPARVMNEDCVNMDEKRHSDFIIGKQPVQHIWGENRKEISNFLEDVNQPTCSLLPENSDSFINGNVINLLSLDQQRIKKPFDKYGYNSMGDICAVASYDKNYSSDRCIGSIFTGPEFNFSSPNLNKTSYLEKCQPNKNYQKEYNNEGNNSGMSFEKDCYPASSEKKGKFERDQPEKIPQIEVQKYPVNHMSNTPFKELHSKKSWDFGLDENLMEKGGMCSIKGIPTSTKKICQYNNDDSSQTSQSSSYSPRPTDSCFSSSSEMLSEDEDQTLQQIEDSSRRSIKTEETTNNSYLERMAEFPHDRIIESNVKSDKQNENFHPSLVKDNTDPFAQSQSNSAHVSQHKTSDPCILQPVRCDAWVQTEHEPVMKEKLDAAVQCDIISECKCRSDVSSLCNAERCSENIKADTTGGQEILKNNCYSEISA